MNKIKVYNVNQTSNIYFKYWLAIQGLFFPYIGVYFSEGNFINHDNADREKRVIYLLVISLSKCLNIYLREDLNFEERSPSIVVGFCTLKYLICCCCLLIVLLKLVPLSANYICL